MTPYPLAWPETMPRAKQREAGRFQTTLAGAIKNVQSSLRLFASDSGKALSGVVVSSNVTLGQNTPADPGVAVWFTWDGLSICIPVDRYQKVEANLQAIHHIIEARRVELRHGTLALCALPLPGSRRCRRRLARSRGERCWGFRPTLRPPRTPSRQHIGWQLRRPIRTTAGRTRPWLWSTQRAPKR